MPRRHEDDGGRRRSRSRSRSRGRTRSSRRAHAGTNTELADRLERVERMLCAIAPLSAGRGRRARDDSVESETSPKGDHVSHRGRDRRVGAEDRGVKNRGRDRDRRRPEESINEDEGKKKRESFCPWSSCGSARLAPTPQGKARRRERSRSNRKATNFADCTYLRKRSNVKRGQERRGQRQGRRHSPSSGDASLGGRNDSRSRSAPNRASGFTTEPPNRGGRLTCSMSREGRQRRAGVTRRRHDGTVKVDFVSDRV